MSRRSMARFAVSLMGAGGLIGLQLLGVGAAAGDDRAGCGYVADVVTATDLTLDRTTLAPGQTTTARATVTSGAGVPPGSVTFQVTGHAASTVTLSAGHATYPIPTDLVTGGYSVTATYPGAPCYLPSSDSASLQIRDVAPAAVPPAQQPPAVAPPEVAPPAVAPPEVAPPEVAPNEVAPPAVAPPEVAPPEVAPNEVAPAEAAVSPVPLARPAPSQGLLPSTGADSRVTWYGLAGLGLLGAGGITLLAHRRRGTSS